MADTQSHPVVPLCEPDLTGNESRYLQEAIASGFVSSVGPFVERFETAFAERVGACHAVAVASGTAAIHLALLTAGVGPDDLVLCSDCTFIASANPARYCGADVAFIDCEAQSWNMDPALLAQALQTCAEEGRLPKAVILVHLYGAPAELGAIVKACAEHGVTLIEDATEALGGAHEGRQVGTFGRCGCFSFNGNKMITSGGGGMVVTDDADLAARIRHLSTQAKVAGIGYIHDDVGYNYRLTNIAAAVGCAQLERLDDFIKTKCRLADRYQSLLPEAVFQQVGHDQSHCWWLPTVLIDNRDAWLQALNDRGIRARPAWQPLHQQPAYASSRHWSNGVAERIGRAGLSLPASVTLVGARWQHVAGTIEKMLGASS